MYVSLQSQRHENRGSVEGGRCQVVLITRNTVFFFHAKKKRRKTEEKNLQLMEIETILSSVLEHYEQGSVQGT